MADTTPKDLQTVAQPDTDKNYFNFKSTGLKVNETYAIKFQWAYPDGTKSDWSPGYFLTTSNETAPAVPTSVTVPTTATGSIPVTLDSFPTNAKRVDVYVTNGIFGTGRVAHSFTTAGTATIAAPAGYYTVQLRSVSPTNVTSTVGTTFNITISDVGETIQAPTNPNGFSSKRILAGIEVSWAGTYANNTFTGFEAINIYAGSSASATPGTYEQVGVLTGNNVKNTIVVPLGTYVVYGQPVYIHAAAVNKTGAVGTIQANVTNQPLGPGKATDADINDGAVVISKLASDVLTVGNLKAGDINATSYIRAGTASSARVELASSTVGSVLPGFYIYNSAGTPILSAPLTGGLSIVGNGTFTGNITGASGQFDGDLGASGGSFTVRSGEITATAGKIGEWVINNNALKSSTFAFPSIQLDPVSSRIELRGSPGASDIGNYIKIDTTNGLRVGSGALPKFKVDMNGVLSAQDVVVSGEITGSTITGSLFRTSTSGQRVEIPAGGYEVNFHSGSTLESSPGSINSLYAFINGQPISWLQISSPIVNNQGSNVTVFPDGVLLNGVSHSVNTGYLQIKENYSGVAGSGTSGYVRNIYIRPTGDGAPSTGTGINGDLWIQY